MRQIELKKGLNVPLTGEPQQSVTMSPAISRVALLGDDYIGMKPTMEVAVGDFVKTGQLLFRDKKNPGVVYTSPATGKVAEINRGAKRRFESIIIDVEEDEFVPFLSPGEKPISTYSSEEVRDILINSSLWTGFKTRPYGKIPPIDSHPKALFVTAMDTRPLAADPAVVISASQEDFYLGLQVINRLTDCPSYLCVKDSSLVEYTALDSIEVAEFNGPHPAGLPSTHIHFLHPAEEKEVVWHIDYQDVIGIGHLFRTSHLPTMKTISLGGPAVLKPGLATVRIGSDLYEICRDQLISSPNRILSGSALDGRQVKNYHHFLGRYHNQVTVLHEGAGRGLFIWAGPGTEIYSLKNIFVSAFNRKQKFPMNTALWGGERAVYPIDSYDKVMPLDIIPLALLKSIAIGDTERSRNLGALELIEEDVALLSFVCPGKNDFGPMLRSVLSEIELEG